MSGRADVGCGKEVYGGRITALNHTYRSCLSQDNQKQKNFPSFKFPKIPIEN